MIMGYVLGEGLIKKTRVRHTCCVCDNHIEPGESCYWQTNDGFGEWDFGTCYWHLTCENEIKNGEYYVN